MPDQSYVLSPGLPPRLFIYVAVAEGVGAVLLGLGVALQLTYLIIIGAVVFGLAAAAVIWTIVMRARVTTKVVVDDQQIMITSGGRTASAAWTEISDVSAAGQTIYLNRYHQQPPLKVDSPRGSSDPALARLSRELVARMDESRGYRDL
ncbi:MAG: hypothetical protein J2P23_14325 [Microlunatus sp.]|nr:hypothetical protein [Microlunatus sp.]